MTGKIIDKKEIAQGTLMVVFEANEPFTFKPGQYCFITLKNLKVPDDRGSRRHFSIVNSPSEKGIITITTRLSDSGFKKTLREMGIGEEVELGPIAGTFTLPMHKPGLESNLQTVGSSHVLFVKLVLIAGGIGITPFMSMLTHLKETGNPYDITLVYSNRDLGSTAFLSEVQDLADTLPNFKLILTMTEDPDWEGEKKRIDANFIREYFPNVNSNTYMVVGPPKMVEAVQAALTQAGTLPDNIRLEKFTGY